MMKVLNSYSPLAALAAVMATSPVPAAAVGRAVSLNGTWRVTGVAVSDEGVQALSDDDASLIGKVLTITSAQMGWKGSDEVYDVCVAPALRARAGAIPTALRPRLRKLHVDQRTTTYAVRCRNGRWGPERDAVIYLTGRGVLVLPWYDGGVLKLQRR